MAFTGNEGESISLSTAGDMTLAFRNSIIINILTGLLNPLFPTSFTLGKDDLQDLIDQGDAVGVRFYHTVDSILYRKIVAVAADADEDDLTGGLILDHTGTSINLSAAATLTAAFRTSITDPITEIIDSTIPQAHFVGKDTLQELLDQSGTVAIRIYKGRDAENDDKLCLVMLGVDSNGDDMSEGLILEKFDNCPPYCASSNSLNS